LRKAAAGIAALLLVVVAALLVVPGFLDWDRFKPEIARRLTDLTGREVTLAGPVTLAFLPVPTVSARDVRVANPPGAAAPELVRLGALDIRLAILPLFSARVVATSVTLDTPVIELQRFADGRNNWTFAVAEAPAKSDSGASAAPAPPIEKKSSGEPLFAIDKLAIRDGTIVYRTPDAVERIEKLEASGRIEGVPGPLNARGNVVLRGARLNFDIDLGRFDGERAPLRAALDLASSAHAELVGALLWSDSGPTVSAALKLSTADLGDVAKTAGATVPPWVVGRKANLEGQLSASLARIGLAELTLALDETRAAGAMSAALTAPFDVQLRLAMNQLDLDKLAASAAPPPKSAGAASMPGMAPAVAVTPPTNAPTLSLPPTIRASLDLVAEAIVWRSQVIRKSQLRASLVDGVIRIDRVAALLPGGSDVSFSGKLTAAGGKPLLEGEIEAESDNLRGVLDWLGIATEPVPADRLRKASLAGRIAASSERIDIAGLDLSVDASRLTGAATVALRERIGIGARLAIDRVNLDAYLPAEAPAAAPTSPLPTTQPSTGANPAKAAPSGASPLARLDANLDVTIGGLSWRGQTIDGLHLSGMLQAGDLTIREATAKDVAGSAVKLSGLVRELGSATPQLQLALDARGAAFERTARLLAPALGNNFPALGAYTLEGEVQGDLRAFAFEGDLAAAGGRLHAAGEHRLGTATQLSLDVAHPEGARLLTTLFPSYRPAGGTLGALAVAAKLDATDDRIAARNLSLTLGRFSLSGTAALRLGGTRPALAADLAFGDLALDRLLPARQTAARSMPNLLPGIQLAQASGPRSGDAGRWSRDRIELASLDLIDADVTLSGATLSYARWRLEKPSLALHLKDAVLAIERLEAGVFGGSVKGDGELKGTGQPTLKLALAMRNADLKEALAEAANIERIDGRADLDLTLSSTGTSQYELISKLGGDGKLAARDGIISGIDIPAASRGLNEIGRIADLLDLARAASHGETRFSRLAGTFKIDNGVVHSDDLLLDADAAEGNATAIVDLPRWQLQNRIAFRLTEHPKAPPLVMTLEGPLDNPRKVFDVNALQGFIVQRGLGSLLKPGGIDPHAPPDPAAPGNQPQKPERILRDLFKGLSR
jgi:uncharacterized protein involved in outer membrane biogenesis